MTASDLLLRPDSAAQSVGAANDPQGRSLPANLEAEAAFIGAALIDNRVLEELPVELRRAALLRPRPPANL